MAFQCFGAVLKSLLSVRAENQPWVVHVSQHLCADLNAQCHSLAPRPGPQLRPLLCPGPGWTCLPPLPSPFYIGIGWASPRFIQVPVLIKVRIPELGGSEDSKSVL